MRKGSLKVLWTFHRILKSKPKLSFPFQLDLLPFLILSPNWAVSNYLQGIFALGNQLWNTLTWFLECNWNCQFAFNSAKINCRLTHDLAAKLDWGDLNESARLADYFSAIRCRNCSHKAHSDDNKIIQFDVAVVVVIVVIDLHYRKAN